MDDLLATAFDDFADMIFICDAGERIVFLNPAARRLALGDAIGTRLDAALWGDWFDVDDQPIAPKDWPLRRALRGETGVEVEGYRCNADGNRFWMLLSAAPIHDANGSIVGAAGSAKDITERKKADEKTRALNEELARRVGARTAAFEAAQSELAREVRGRLDAAELLERSRRMLQAILDRTTAAIYVKDTTFRYLLVNSHFERTFNVANADVAGRTDYELFPREIVDPLRANDERVLITGEPLHCDEVVPHEDGLHTYVSVKFPLRDDGGVIYGLCGISTDITERKAMEAELRRSQATLSTVIESCGDAIFLIDRDHHLVLSNAVVGRMFEYLYGRTPRTGVNLMADVPATLGERWHALIERALNGEQFTVEESIRIKEATRHYLLSLNPIKEESRVSGITVFGKDITLLRNAEEQARRHQAELAHVLRLHTLGQMAASLAHEINQPLGAIANYAQGSRRRLEAGTMAPAEMKYTMGEIAREALRAGEITRRLRELIRKEEPAREPADINQIVAAALEIVGPTARDRGTVVRFRQGAYLPPVEVDRIQIEQVVLNLMLNALDAIEVGPEARQIEVRTSALGDRAVEVAVCDSGVGLDPALVESIFEPFHTTKTNGLGMGLAISRSIIEAHEGRLWAAPNADVGSTFSFELPAMKAQTR